MHKLPRKKREGIDQIKKLEAELCEMEKELPKKYLESLFKNICKSRFEIHEIYFKKSEYALFQLKTAFYELGEKTGRLLARQLKEQSSAHIIPAIRTGDSLVTSSKGINNVFREFYDNLYRPSGVLNEILLQQFLTNIHLPNLPPEKVAFLDNPLMQDEVKCTILAMKAGKSPGTDGLPVEYM